MDVKVNIEDLNVSHSIPIIWSIYPPDCLERATSDYQHLCEIEQSNMTSNGCVITIRIREHRDEQTVRNEFLNYLLEISLERHLQR
jgi:hypothetical protein